eukprot:542955_1
MLEHIGPNDSSVSFTSFILFSSAIIALLFQPIFANLIKTIVTMYDPLAPFWGRIEMPYQHMNDDNNIDNVNENKYHEAGEHLNEHEADILNEIENEREEEERQRKIEKENEELTKIMAYIVKWERRKNFCPLICWIILFILIIVNILSAAV